MAYDPRPVEPVIYKRWLEAGVFQPRPDGEAYVIVIPPPNVTDVLHVGHALNNVIQDVLIRFERMRGRTASPRYRTKRPSTTRRRGICTTSSIRWRTAPERSQWRPRVRKRCSATSGLSSIRKTAATRP